MGKKRLDTAIVFQSTPPARGATYVDSMFYQMYRISIHAPREGGDLHTDSWPIQYSSEFQSTPPARGATVIQVLCGAESLISIHAPREGGD